MFGKLKMITSNLRINQLSEQAYAWYLEYLKVLDSKDVEGYGQFLGDECIMQVNNSIATIGKRAVIERLSYYWRSFDSLEHDLLNIYGTDRAFVLEAFNHYRRIDGKEISLRAVAFTDRDNEGKVRSIRLYADTSELFLSST